MIDPGTLGLERFLKEAVPLIAELGRGSRPTPSLDPVRLKQALEDITPPLAQARGQGILINPWTLAGLKNLEVRNSAVLAQLWRPEVGGDTSRAFLAAFLAELTPTGDIELPTFEQLEHHYSVKVEELSNGNSAERIDIVIESHRFIIGIEIKIKAKEGPGQLKKYCDAIAQRAKSSHRDWYVIFLSPSAPALNLPVITANWSAVVRAAHACIPTNRKERSTTHRLIAQFASHVATFERKTR